MQLLKKTPDTGKSAIPRHGTEPENHIFDISSSYHLYANFIYFVPRTSKRLVTTIILTADAWEAKSHHEIVSTHHL